MLKNALYFDALYRSLYLNARSCFAFVLVLVDFILPRYVLTLVLRSFS